MDLSRDIVKEFAEVTNDSNVKKTDNTVYGTIVKYNDRLYAKLDGSGVLTPISTTANIKPGERVIVTVKNHSATVTGNSTDPSAGSKEVTEMGTSVQEFDQLKADAGGFTELSAQIASIDTIKADNVQINGKLDAHSASITTLEAKNVEITGKLEANEAEIGYLKADSAKLANLSAQVAEIDRLKADAVEVEELEADLAEIETLKAGSTFVENLDAKYANIDFANIGKAAMEHLYAESGLIKDVTIGDATITGELVGVTLKGDLIEAGTLKADKLVIKGEDGLYYKLNVTEGGIQPSEKVTEEQLQNGLHGSNIIAQTITAEKISVSDLVAFDATIGRFKIGDADDEHNYGRIYSLGKDEVNSSAHGIYLDSSGQMSIGDSNQYLKYFKDLDGSYHLMMAVNSLSIAGTSIDKTLGDLEDAIDSAEKVATNFMDYSSSSGLQIGNKTSGSWAGFRARITGTAYDILDSAGTLLARYGANLVELGRNSINAIIKLCGGKGTIAYGQIDKYTGDVKADDNPYRGNDTLSISSDEDIEISGLNTRLRSRAYDIHGEYGTPESYLSGSSAGVDIDPQRVILSVGEMDNATWEDSVYDYVGVGTNSYVDLTSQSLSGEIYGSIGLLSKTGNVTVNTPNGYVNINGGVRIDSNPVADFVVEEGEKDGWFYKKWNNGSAECYMVYYGYGVNAGKNYYNNFYYSDAISVPFPFTFTNIPVVHVDGGSSSHMNFVRTFGHTQTSAKFMVIGLISVSKTDITVDIQARGRWK